MPGRGIVPWTLHKLSPCFSSGSCLSVVQVSNTLGMALFPWSASGSASTDRPAVSARGVNHAALFEFPAEHRWHPSASNDLGPVALLQSVEKAAHVLRIGRVEMLGLACPDDRYVRIADVP